MMRKHRAVNSRAAVYSVVYPLQAVEPPREEDPPKKVLEPLPVKKRLPGVLLLKKLAKQQEKQKEKRRPTMDRVIDRAIDQDAVDIAVVPCCAPLRWEASCAIEPRVRCVNNHQQIGQRRK